LAEEESIERVEPTQARKMEMLTKYFETRLRTNTDRVVLVEAIRTGKVDETFAAFGYGDPGQMDPHMKEVWDALTAAKVRGQQESGQAYSMRMSEQNRQWAREVNLRRQENIAIERILSQISLAKADAEVASAYIHRFHQFLRGKPCPKDAAKMKSLGFKDEQFMPFQGEGVQAYLKAFSALRAEYYLALTLLKQRGPGNTLRSIEIYYKYLVDGDDLDTIDLKGIWYWLEFGREEFPKEIVKELNMQYLFFDGFGRQGDMIKSTTKEPVIQHGGANVGGGRRNMPPPAARQRAARRGGRPARVRFANVTGIANNAPPRTREEEGTEEEQASTGTSPLSLRRLSLPPDRMTSFTRIEGAAVWASETVQPNDMQSARQSAGMFATRLTEYVENAAATVPKDSPEYANHIAVLGEEAKLAMARWVAKAEERYGEETHGIRDELAMLMVDAARNDSTSGLLPQDVWTEFVQDVIQPIVPNRIDTRKGKAYAQRKAGEKDKGKDKEVESPRAEEPAKKAEEAPKTKEPEVEKGKPYKWPPGPGKGGDNLEERPDLYTKYDTLSKAERVPPQAVFEAETKAIREALAKGDRAALDKWLEARFVQVAPAASQKEWESRVGGALTGEVRLKDGTLNYETYNPLTGRETPEELASHHKDSLHRTLKDSILEMERYIQRLDGELPLDASRARLAHVHPSSEVSSITRRRLLAWTTDPSARQGTHIVLPGPPATTVDQRHKPDFDKDEAMKPNAGDLFDTMVRFLPYYEWSIRNKHTADPYLGSALRDPRTTDIPAQPEQSTSGSSEPEPKKTQTAPAPTTEVDDAKKWVADWEQAVRAAKEEEAKAKAKETPKGDETTPDDFASLWEKNYQAALSARIRELRKSQSPKDQETANALEARVGDQPENLRRLEDGDKAVMKNVIQAVAHTVQWNPELLGETKEDAKAELAMNFIQREQKLEGERLIAAAKQEAAREPEGTIPSNEGMAELVHSAMQPVGPAQKEHVEADARYRRYLATLYQNKALYEANKDSELDELARSLEDDAPYGMFEHKKKLIRDLSTMKPGSKKWENHMASIAILDAKIFKAQKEFTNRVEQYHPYGIPPGNDRIRILQARAREAAPPAMAAPAAQVPPTPNMGIAEGMAALVNSPIKPIVTAQTAEGWGAVKPAPEVFSPLDNTRSPVPPLTEPWNARTTMKVAERLAEQAVQRDDIETAEVFNDIAERLEGRANIQENSVAEVLPEDMVTTETENRLAKPNRKRPSGRDTPAKKIKAPDAPAQSIVEKNTHERLAELLGPGKPYADPNYRSWKGHAGDNREGDLKELDDRYVEVLKAMRNTHEGDHVHAWEEFARERNLPSQAGRKNFKFEGRRDNDLEPDSPAGELEQQMYAELEAERARATEDAEHTATNERAYKRLLEIDAEIQALKQKAAPSSSTPISQTIREVAKKYTVKPFARETVVRPPNARLRQERRNLDVINTIRRALAQLPTEMPEPAEEMPDVSHYFDDDGQDIPVIETPRTTFSLAPSVAPSMASTPLTLGRAPPWATTPGAPPETPYMGSALPTPRPSASVSYPSTPASVLPTPRPSGSPSYPGTPASVLPTPRPSGSPSYPGTPASALATPRPSGSPSYPSSPADPGSPTPDTTPVSGESSPVSSPSSPVAIETPRTTFSAAPSVVVSPAASPVRAPSAPASPAVIQTPRLNDLRNVPLGQLVAAATSPRRPPASPVARSPRVELLPEPSGAFKKPAPKKAHELRKAVLQKEASKASTSSPKPTTTPAKPRTPSPAASPDFRKEAKKASAEKKKQSATKQYTRLRHGSKKKD
jgi:hypothetical protein